MGSPKLRHNRHKPNNRVNSDGKKRRFALLSAAGYAKRWASQQLCIVLSVNSVSCCLCLPSACPAGQAEGKAGRTAGLTP